MTRNFFLTFLTTIFCLTNSLSAFADTVDVWTVKVNGEVVINSNETEIWYDHPMLIKLASYSDNDTLQICYSTDSWMEIWEWNLLLKDSNNVLIEKRSNPIEDGNIHKNYVEFTVRNLKMLLQNKNLNAIYIEFDQKGYLGRNICIISN
jgi:hypothetical protein